VREITHYVDWALREMGSYAKARDLAQDTLDRPPVTVQGVLVQVPGSLHFAEFALIGSGWAKRHLRIRAHSATGQVAGAAIY